MCYVLTEDGNNEIDLAKPVKIYWCICYFDSLVLAEFCRETCHNKIFEFLNITEEHHFFSILVNKNKLHNDL